MCWSGQQEHQAFSAIKFLNVNDCINILALYISLLWALLILIIIPELQQF